MTGHLAELLRSAACRTPDALAVCDGTTTLTYRELDERSGQLAHLLAEVGSGPGRRVGLFLDKGVDAVVAIHAVLRSGAAYVPIDPLSPVARAVAITRGAGLSAVVSGATQQPAWPALVEAGVEHLVVPGELPGAPPPAGAVLWGPNDIAGRPTGTTAGRAGMTGALTEDDPAYILYTSGSTGVPKGVVLSHRNALAFVRWAVDEFAIGPEDRLANHAPLHFDLSVLDVFATAAAGASVHLVPHGTSAFPSELARFAREHGITVWYSVPSALTMLVERGRLAEHGLPDLRLVLFAGEVFPAKHLRRLMELVPHPEYANLYGPTETNVCTFHRVAEPPVDDRATLPIGTPLPGVTCRVVRDDGSLAPPGEPGELWVRGPTVMQGYWGDPERSARALRPDPVDPTAGTCYRTGDIVVEDHDGCYRLLGRRDHQVKSRGYRIELGEIEAALNAHPAVAECAVVAVADERISNRIEAFVVADGSVGRRQLVGHCRQALPSYMVPQRLTVLPELPRTSTGKVDRTALTSEC